MNKYAIVSGIPLEAACSIIIYENPKYLWLIIAVPLALMKFLVNKQLKKPPEYIQSSNESYLDTTHTSVVNSKNE